MTSEQMDVRTRILLAAKRLFAKYGYDGTSVRQICEEAGGNVALVSYHFGGKENVLYAIFDEFFPATNPKLDKYELFLQEPVEGIKFLIKEIICFFAQDEELSKIIHQEVSMQGKRTEKIRFYVFPVWMKMKKLLEKGRDQGLFHFQSLDWVLMITMGALIFPNECTHEDGMEPLIKKNAHNLNQKIEQTISFVLGGLSYSAK